MRQAILSSLFLGILISATGCTASGRSARTAMTPTSDVADTSSDPSWMPPDEWSLKTTGETKKSRPSVALGALPAPNRRAIARGQVHEAY